MMHSKNRAPAAPPASLRWAVMLLCAFALLHLLSLVPIPWDLSWKSALIASLILGPHVVVPLIAAAGIRARAQWAWYLAMLFAGWYAIRSIVVMVATALNPSTGPAFGLLRSTLPVAVVAGLCVALVVVLARADVRAALSVRIGSTRRAA